MYISDDIVRYIASYMIHMPRGVCRKWCKAIDLYNPISVSRLVGKYKDLATIMCNGSDDEVKYAFKVNPRTLIPIGSTDILGTYAIQRRYNDVLVWLNVTYGGNIRYRYLIYTSIRTHNIDAMMTMLSSKYMDETDMDMVISSICIYGTDHMLQCICDKYDIHHSIVSIRCFVYLYGRVDMVRMIPNYTSTDEVIASIVHNGVCPTNTVLPHNTWGKVATYAAYHGLHDVIAITLSHDVLAHSIVYGAAMGGMVDIISKYDPEDAYAINKICNNVCTQIRVGMAKPGHLGVLQYIYSRYNVIFTKYIPLIYDAIEVVESDYPPIFDYHTVPIKVWLDTIHK